MKDNIEKFYHSVKNEATYIPMPYLPRLNKYLKGFCSSRIYLLGASTGSGKTTFVDYNIFNLINNKQNKNLHFLYYTLEMSIEEKIANFSTAILYKKYSKIIEPEYILGYGRQEGLVKTQEEIDKESDVIEKLENIKDELSYLLEHITFKEKLNPTGLLKDVEQQYKEKENLFCISIIDHVGLIKREKQEGEYLNKKQSIDKTSEYAVELRNKYKASFIFIQQLNRALGELNRRKFEELTVTLEDFKETGNLSEDANVVLATFSPLRYNIKEHRGYDLTKLKDTYRPLQVLKNRNGIANISIGLYFRGDGKYFKELPKTNEIANIGYDNIFKW